MWLIASFFDAVVLISAYCKKTEASVRFDFGKVTIRFLLLCKKQCFLARLYTLYA